MPAGRIAPLTLSLSKGVRPRARPVEAPASTHGNSVAPALPLTLSLSKGVRPLGPPASGA